MPSKNGMVATIHPLAAEAGVRIMKRGGNAIDAAVATSAAMGVVAPQYSGLGGGGFILIHLSKAGETVVIDCREVAPKKADASLFKRKATRESTHALGAGEVEESTNRMGYKAVGVPGNLAGLSLALERYGTMSLKDLLQPAIALAEDGFPVSRRLAQTLENNIDDAVTKSKLFPGTGKIYLRGGGTYGLNDKIVNTDLASTFRKLAANGPEIFYSGQIADAIEADMAAHGGLITSEDLVRYRPIVRKPIVSTYRDCEVVTTPPPSGGGVIDAETLNILEEFELHRTGHNTAESIHLISEAMMHAFADKSKYAADPDFAKVPYEGLVSKAYAKNIAQRIDPKRASVSIDPGQPERFRNDTVHFSVVDKDRNVVAMTESIECYFGSGVTVPGTGFLLNDQMHDFDPEPGGINSIEPGKRPVSNMAPVILLRDGELFLTLGGAGGPRIPSSSIAVITNTVDFGMNVKEAVSAPRFHAQNMEINVDPAITENARQDLSKMGHKVSLREVVAKEWWYFGAVQAIMYDANTGDLTGAADPRRDGEAIGY
jgi:gamma-glutamyltranspeptidase/glutathione hydrolase